MPAPLHRRIPPLITLAILAPVCAELSSGYLEGTGDPIAIASQLVLFVPLYGGAAVCIREVAVRRGLGWLGVALLAAAFGTVQAGITDRSIFTLTGTGIAYWPRIMEATWVEPFGFAAGATFGWVLGHVITSIMAPIVLTEALFPQQRGRPLLGRAGLVLAPLLLVLISVAVRMEVDLTYRPVPTLAQQFAVVAVASGLIAVGLSRIGRAVPPATGGDHDHLDPDRRRWWWWLIAAVLGAVAMLAADSAATSWVYVAGSMVVISLVLVGIAALRRINRLDLASLVALFVGALLARGVQAFATPAAGGVDEHAKLVQHAVFLLGVIALGALTLRQADRPRRRPARTDRSVGATPV